MKYTIKKGRHYAFSIRRFIPFRWSKFKKKKLTFTVKVENLYNTLGDNDLRFDLNKLFGVNLSAFKASNINSIMIGFRSNDEVYENTLYRNSNGSNIYDVNPSNLVFAKDGIVTSGSIEWISGNTYRVTYQDKQWFFEEPHRSWLCRYIYTWFGGKDDGNDGLGGFAPEDISVELNYKWIKK